MSSSTMNEPGSAHTPDLIEHARRHFSRAPELAKTEQWFWDDDFFARVVGPLCGLAPGRTVLDVGAGIGALSRRLHPLVQPDGRILGVELQQENVDAGNAYNAELGFDGIELRAGDARQLCEIVSESFDLVAEVGMLCLLANNQERSDVLSQMVALTRPGGRVMSLEIDMSALLAAIDSDSHKDLRRWISAFIEGMRVTEHEDLRLAPAMPGMFVDTGLTDVRIVPYITPEPMPPFTDTDISLAEDFGAAWFDTSTSGHQWMRWYLVQGGLPEHDIDQLATKLGRWWAERIDTMRQNRFPPLMTQVFLLTIGTKPAPLAA